MRRDVVYAICVTWSQWGGWGGGGARRRCRWDFLRTLKGSRASHMRRGIARGGRGIVEGAPSNFSGRRGVTGWEGGINGSGRGGS